MIYLETLLTHCAGMVVHQKEIVVCALTGTHEDNVQQEVKTFSTLTKSLFDLLKRLEEKEITHIAMDERS